MQTQAFRNALLRSGEQQHQLLRGCTLRLGEEEYEALVALNGYSGLT